MGNPQFGWEADRSEDLVEERPLGGCALDGGPMDLARHLGELRVRGRRVMRQERADACDHSFTRVCLHKADGRLEAIAEQVAAGQPDAAFDEQVPFELRGAWRAAVGEGVRGAKAERREAVQKVTVSHLLSPAGPVLA